MTRGRAIAIVATVLVLTGIALALAWPRPPVIAAHVVTTQYASFETTLPATGTLQRAHLQTLPAMVAGTIARIAVASGQRVASGAVLVTLVNPTLVSAAATTHEAYLAAAARARIAAAAHAADADALQADAAARNDEWQFALAQAAALQIRAPFAGSIETIAAESGDSTRPLQPGDPVTAGMPLVTLAAGDGFIVRLAIEEEDAPHVHAGQPARIRSDDFAGHVLDGHVTAIDAVARKSEASTDIVRHVITTIGLDQTLPYLRDGMRVDVDVIVNRAQHVVSIVPAAIRRDDDGSAYVYVVRDGTAHKTAVTLGPMNITSAVIRSGLRAGERVVGSRDPDIIDGTRIRG